MSNTNNLTGFIVRSQPPMYVGIHSAGGSEGVTLALRIGEKEHMIAEPFASAILQQLQPSNGAAA